MSILRYLGLSLILLAFAACGSTGTTTPEGDADVLEDASTEPDATTPPPPPTCERLTCADLVKDGRVPCGIVAGTDGCGGTLACADAGDANNGCPEGFYCQGEDDGVARCQELTAEECTTRIDEADACDGVCGSVPTGCYGETYNCGGCDEGFFCQGGSCRANACTTQRDCTNAGPGGTAVSCGVWGDGCGSTIDCTAETGGCGAGEVCDPSGACVVDAPPECLLTAADACAGTCGVVSNGCDGTYNCADEGFGCPGGTICGVANPGDTPTCGSWDTCTVDTTALVAQCAGKCGFISDGCDGVFNCSAPGNGGLTCSAPNTCGGGGVHNTCGVPESSCEAEPEATTCANRCGPVNNNCGEIVQCGGCPAGEACGNGGPFTCGPTACSPINAAAACAGKCGYISDGCDGEYNCAEHGGIVCPSGQTCGYSGVPNTCGGASCTEETCADRGATCGTIISCGNVINCGADPANPQSCPNPAEGCVELTPGVPVCTDEGGSGGCAGSPEVCNAVPVCAPGSPTRITGFVTTPDGELRVPNAVIYIQDPSETLPAIPEGVDYDSATASCERCDDQNHGLGRVLAAGTTDFKGEYTMTGAIPIGIPVRVVVKTGRWRGVYTHTFTEECTTTNAAGTFKLPGRHNAATGDHLPKIAVATGNADAMECVLYKMGIELDEFTTTASVTKPAAGSRIHLYRTNGGRMRERPRCWGSRNACRNASSQVSQSACEAAHNNCSWRANGHQNEWFVTTTDTSALFDNDAANGDLFDYDMAVWDCSGSSSTSDNEATNTRKTRLLRYMNHGGRFFASHWSYHWLTGNSYLGSAFNLGTSRTGNSTGDAHLSYGRPRHNPIKLPAFAKWLRFHGAGTITPATGEPTSGFIPVIDPRGLVSTVNQDVDEWMYWNYSSSERHVQQFSLNTPYDDPNAESCGRVAFTAFHVAGSTSPGNSYFPSYCSTNQELTDQERTLAYMIFDLANCVSSGEPPRPPECEPKTAADCASNQCGTHSDGCGGTISCGGCEGGDYCSPVSGVCEVGCSPQDPCAGPNGYTCGTHSDGCFSTVDCGSCDEGEICGFPETGHCSGCIPISCDAANAECGPIADGCGGYTECGSNCPEGQVCGGGGTPNQCGSGSCDPTQCKEWECGTIADGCGGFVNCGGCAEGEACGIVEANHCSVICEAETLEEACAGLQCGYVADGCGGSHYCGDCTNGGDCGGAGANMCGEPCPATTCAAEGANCGFIQDGCGTLLDCGTCEGTEVCGASAPNVCGAGTCEPSNACPVVADSQSCGTISDGCDGQIECGDCPVGSYCSNDNICVPGEGACEPDSCEDHNATCGSPPDGCGGQLDCGTCPSGQICGFPVAYTCGGGAG